MAENTKSPGDQFILNKGDKLFESSGDLYFDLQQVETKAQRLILVGTQLEQQQLTPQQAIFLVEEFLWKSVGTLFSNQADPNSQRAAYLLNELYNGLHSIRLGLNSTEAS